MMMTINDKLRSFVRPTKSSPRFYNDMEVDLNLVGHMACVWDLNPSLEWFAHQVGGTLLAGSILLKFPAMVVRPLSMNFPPLIGGRVEEHFHLMGVRSTVGFNICCWHLWSINYGDLLPCIICPHVGFFQNFLLDTRS